MFQKIVDFIRLFWEIQEFSNVLSKWWRLFELTQAVVGFNACLADSDLDLI